jgi:2-polyprenyl-3-methyl-5-hydroxy-6-metoxy-1,4-benzoquinol methylase
MTDLEITERKKYNHIWKLDAYRVKCHGLNLWTQRRYLFPDDPKTAIDLGYGTGRLVRQWHDEGIDGYGVDISENAADRQIMLDLGDHLIIGPLWDFTPPMRCDIGVCADVLEHIPEERVDDVLRNIARSCKTAFLKIACFESHWDGLKLHMTVRDPAWWIKRVADLGGEIEAIDQFSNNALFVWQTPE